MVAQFAQSVLVEDLVGELDSPADQTLLQPVSEFSGWPSTEPA